MMKINWVDILIVAYIIRAFFHGKARGLSFEVTAFFAAILSWVVALHYYQGLGESLSKWFLLKLETARMVSFALVSVCILFLGAVISRLIKKIVKLSFIPNVEKVGGCILGTLRGISISAIIIVALVLVPKEAIQNEIYVNSFLGNYMVALSPRVYGWIMPKGAADTKKFSVSEFWGQLPERPKDKVL